MKQTDIVYDLIIIGAGAAGLFAAANAPVDWNTLVLEKTDSPGKKLLLTGSGQCNLTNNEPIKAFLSRYGENGKRLRAVLFPFSNLALMEFFEQHGLPLKVREDGKVFPASMKSVDILNLLLDLCKNNGVIIRYRSAVTEISSNTEVAHNTASECSIYSVKTTDGQNLAKNILVATGGESYPQTGSDGSLFACLDTLGLSIIPRQPALTPIFVHDYPYSDLSGLTFPKTTVSVLKRDDKKSVVVEGSLLLTHKGFSGPSILGISRYASEGDRLIINYLPERTHEDLRLEMIKTAAGDPRQIVTILESITALPRSFLERACNKSDIAKNEKASRLSGHEMGTLAEQITADSYKISSTGGFSVAMTTAGGVNLDEINIQTMEAKRFTGLYFAGEVLDVDGDTGGYNLQFAFSSAKRSIEAMRS